MFTSISAFDHVLASSDASCMNHQKKKKNATCRCLFLSLSNGRGIPQKQQSGALSWLKYVNHPECKTTKHHPTMTLGPVHKYLNKIVGFCCHFLSCCIGPSSAALITSSFLPDMWAKRLAHHVASEWTQPNYISVCLRSTDDHQIIVCTNLLLYARFIIIHSAVLVIFC